jgi:L-fucose isomerase-like protein
MGKKDKSAVVDKSEKLAAKVAKKAEKTAKKAEKVSKKVVASPAKAASSAEVLSKAVCAFAFYVSHPSHCYPEEAVQACRRQA